MGEAHRAKLKQSNKAHHGAKKANKGRAVQTAGGIGKLKAKNLGASLGKKDRRNLRTQLKNVAVAKLKPTAVAPAPKLVVVLAFHADANVSALEGTLGGSAPLFASQHPTRRFPGSKDERYTLTVPARELEAVLDACKCADVVVGCFPARCTVDAPPFDELGYKLLSALKLQGLPSLIGVMPEEEAMVAAKVRTDTRKLVERFFKSEAGETAKLVDPGHLLRTLRGLRPTELTYREGRGYLLADRTEYDASTQRLVIWGYARGVGFSPRFRMHVTGAGDFCAESVAVVKEDAPGAAVELIDEGASPDPEDLLREFDPTAQEQTWPTEDELKHTTRVKVPKGAPRDPTSVAWLGDIDEEAEEDDEMEDDADMEDDDESGDDDSVPDETPEEQFNKRKLEFEARSREDMDFPDEVDTPTDQPARIRFQKFRGLKSFVTSTWDQYEDLPLSYSRIWDFESVRATTKAGRDAVQEHCGGEGEYCRIILTQVPPLAAGNLVLSTVFPHERKVTVSHVRLTRCDARVTTNDESIKSKTPLSLTIGFRKLEVKPIFAEQRKKQNDKLKFARYFHDGTVIASFLGPAVYAPSPVLAFVAGDEERELVAWGSLLPPDPLKCVVKRSTLTGYPFKCHKTKATIRHMFFDANDIRWFKPVELSTKKGLRGHIICSLGTHGYMKCRFSSRLKHDDTVCMHLYKRMFPPWYPPTWGGRADMAVEDDS